MQGLHTCHLYTRSSLFSHIMCIVHSSLSPNPQYMCCFTKLCPLPSIDVNTVPRPMMTSDLNALTLMWKVNPPHHWLEQSLRERWQWRWCWNGSAQTYQNIGIIWEHLQTTRIDHISQTRYYQISVPNRPFLSYLFVINSYWFLIFPLLFWWWWNTLLKPNPSKLRIPI